MMAKLPFNMPEWLAGVSEEVNHRKHLGRVAGSVRRLAVVGRSRVDQPGSDDRLPVWCLVPQVPGVFWLGVFDVAPGWTQPATKGMGSLQLCCDTKCEFPDKTLFSCGGRASV